MNSPYMIHYSLDGSTRWCLAGITGIQALVSMCFVIILYLMADIGVVPTHYFHSVTMIIHRSLENSHFK